MREPSGRADGLDTCHACRDLHTEDVSVEMLDALAAVNMHVMVAMPHVLNNSVDVNASTWPAFEQELLGNMSMVMHHPALAGCAACF